MINYPVGKGVLIWELYKLWNGDPVALADNAKKMGFDWLAIKVQDGVYTFQNSRLAAAFAALESVGIDCWGWGYLYGGRSNGYSQARWEASVTVKQIRAYNLKGFLMDAESPYKRSGGGIWATRYTQSVRVALPEIPLGLCSYRFPSYHPEFPWTEFLKYTDFHAPQVYWVSSHNPADQLMQSYKELNALAALPFVPVGSAYKTSTWKPTREDVENFNQKAYDENMVGISWWRLGTIFELGFDDLIKAHQWGDVPGVPKVPVPEWAGYIDPWARELGYEGPAPLVEEAKSYNG